MSSKHIYIISSNKWQSRTFNYLLKNLSFDKYTLSILNLRDQGLTEDIWSNLSGDNVVVTDLSNIYKFEHLNLLNSLRNFFSIRKEIQKIIDSNTDESIVVTYDSFYRIYELIILSCLSNTTAFIQFQHGLRTSHLGLKSLVRTPLSNLIRYCLFFLLGSVANNNYRNLLKRIPFYKINFNTKETKKNDYTSGNIQIAATIEELSKYSSKSDSTNILFLSSGAFRTNFDDMKLQTIESFEVALNFCKTNNKKLFIKFKDDEKQNEFAHLLNDSQVTVIENNLDLVSTIKAVQPELVICHSSSTTVAELALSGFKVALYDAIFPDYSDEYLDFYKNLNFLDIIDLKNETKFNSIEPNASAFLRSKLDLNEVDQMVLIKILTNLE
jgi:hypothetical protein